MRKSFFSPSVYNMWLRRYWVGAGLMAVVFALAALLYGLNLSYMIDNPYYQANAGELAVFISESPINIMLGAFVCAAAIVASMLCFRYLQDARAAVMIHSLPPRRETLFRTVVLAGLTLLLGPILLSGCFFGIAMGINGIFQFFPLFHYVLTMASIAVLFFGLASCVAMLTGNTMAQGILTLLFVNLPILVESMVMSYCSRFLFGFTAPELYTAYINPFYWMGVYLMRMSGDYAAQNPISLLVPLVFIAVGLVFLLLAVFLYRVRKIEAAGDVIAMRAVRPVFRYGLALAGAVLFANIFGSVQGSFVIELLFSLAGGALGYYIAEMFIRRSVKVLKHCRGYVLFAAVYAVLVLVLYLDVFGYGSRQLRAEEIEAIAITNESVSDRVYAAMRGRGLNSYTVLEDLDLQDETGYVEKVKKGDISPMPPEIAEQILRQDATVYKGEDIGQAVALQNILAGLAGKLQGTDMAVYPYDANIRYYEIPVIAKLQDGSVFSRVYRFTLSEGEYPQLEEAYEAVERQAQLGRLHNTVRLLDKAERVSLRYSLGGVDTLAESDWSGLMEAYEKDLQAIPPEGFGPVIAEIEVEMPDFSYQHLTVGLGQENVLAWLVDKDYLDEEEIEDFRAYIAESSAQEIYYN